MAAHEDGSVDYRHVARTGIRSALTDAAHQRRNPGSPPLQYEMNFRLVAAQHDPAAVRLFRYAYEQATRHGSAGSLEGL